MMYTALGGVDWNAVHNNCVRVRVDYEWLDRPEIGERVFVYEAEEHLGTFGIVLDYHEGVEHTYARVQLDENYWKPG